jgi:hypothetical protein
MAWRDLPRKLERARPRFSAAARLCAGASRPLRGARFASRSLRPRSRARAASRQRAAAAPSPPPGIAMHRRTADGGDETGASEIFLSRNSARDPAGLLSRTQGPRRGGVARCGSLLARYVLRRLQGRKVGILKRKTHPSQKARAGGGASRPGLWPAPGGWPSRPLVATGS